MKNRLIMGMFAAATISGHSAAIHNGLVNYWTLDGNGADTAGDFAADGATSTLNDAVTAGGTGATILTSGGMFGGAGDFERGTGTDGRLAAADSVDTNFDDQDLTISAWIQFDDNGTRWQGVLGKGEGDNYRLAIENRENTLAYAGGTGDIRGTGVNVQDGAFHHVVTTTTEGGGTEIFINGVSAGTQAGPASIDQTVAATNPNNDEFWIGSNPGQNPGARMWDGLIDDVAQWDRVLTPAEVTEIYTAGLAGTSLGQIPEPTSGLLLGLSGLMVLLRRRR